MDPGRILAVQTGECACLKAVRIILFALALLQLLLISTYPLLKLITISGLLLAFAITSRKLNRLSGIWLLRLHGSGLVTMVHCEGDEIPALLEGNPWISNRVCVLPVGCFDRWPRQHLLVCRSNNHPDDYRRLLCLLRFGIAATDNAADRP